LRSVNGLVSGAVTRHAGWFTAPHTPARLPRTARAHDSPSPRRDFPFSVAHLFYLAGTLHCWAFLPAHAFLYAAFISSLHLVSFRKAARTSCSPLPYVGQTAGRLSFFTVAILLFGRAPHITPTHTTFAILPALVEHHYHTPRCICTATTHTFTRIPCHTHLPRCPHRSTTPALPRTARMLHLHCTAARHAHSPLPGPHTAATRPHHTIYTPLHAHAPHHTAALAHIRPRCAAAAEHTLHFYRFIPTPVTAAIHPNALRAHRLPRCHYLPPHLYATPLLRLPAACTPTPTAPRYTLRIYPTTTIAPACAHLCHTAPHHALPAASRLTQHGRTNGGLWFPNHLAAVAR